MQANKWAKPKAVRGGVIIKNGKIADFFPNRLDPPPLLDISDFFFEFLTYLKNALGSNSDIFEFENLLVAADSFGQTS